ncbi:MAG: ABC transporter substrate-binding protein [Candidatus Nezhaarchaeota archaeon]|nr:ABC transporter substrate-binding protein [Candidatus Nezhaarchaeota archaeon]
MHAVRFSCLPEVTHYVRMHAVEAGVVKPSLLRIEVVYTADINRYLLSVRPELGQVSTGFLPTALGEAELRLVAVYPSYRKKLTENLLLARRGSEVEGPGDLEGRRVGVPGMDKTTTVVALGMLREYARPERVELVEASPGALLAKLDAGEVDAALLLGYYTVEALHSGRYKVVWSPYDDFAKRYGRRPINSLIVAQRGFVEGGRGFREAWRAVQESCAYGKEHWEELVERYVKEVRGGGEALLRAYKDWLSRSGLTIPTAPSSEDLELIRAICEIAEELGVARRAPSVEELSRILAPG